MDNNFYMEHIKSEVESFARIRIIGIGGSGNNAVNHMINHKVKGVEFIAMNSDAQDLHHALAKKKIHIGKNLTKGLGAGGNPDMGRRAAEETREEIANSLKGSHMAFITCGMGGGTGTGAAAVVAKTSRELGALTIGVVTKPFLFEGQERMRAALAGIEELKKEVDALIIIPNDRLLAIVDKDTTIKQAFAFCDDVLKQAVVGISDLITMPGIVNLDFADIRSVMENAGSAIIGVGLASGDKRAEESARSAINSPLLEVSITGARGVLFAIAGGDDLGMLEIQEAARIITESVDPHARIIFGAFKDDQLKKNEMKVTVIATGFPEAESPSSASARAIDGRPTVYAARPEQPLVSEEYEADQKPRGYIFNTALGGTRRSHEENDEIMENTVTPTPDLDAKSAQSTHSPKPVAQNDEDDDDDWGNLPGFLSRSRNRK